VDKSDLQVYPTFGKLMDLARYQAKSRDYKVEENNSITNEGVTAEGKFKVIIIM